MTRENYIRLLGELDDSLLHMGEQVAGTISACFRVLEEGNVVEAKGLIEADNLIDWKRHEIEETALLLIATQQPLAGDLRNLAAALSIATELERIGDYCEGIAKLTLRMAAVPNLPVPVDVRTMAVVVPRLLQGALTAFRDRDMEAAGTIWRRDDEIDLLYERVFRQVLEEMVNDPTTVHARTYHLWVAHNLERMADRVTNIAESVAFVATGDVAAFRQHLETQTVPK